MRSVLAVVAPQLPTNREAVPGASTSAVHLAAYIVAAVVLLFFFFQAEDGIRDYKVTGVQTCALPISLLPVRFVATSATRVSLRLRARATTCSSTRRSDHLATFGAGASELESGAGKIGRASCRERV